VNEYETQQSYTLQRLAIISTAHSCALKSMICLLSQFEHKLD